jgi:CRISPR-associated protein Csx17
MTSKLVGISLALPGCTPEPLMSYLKALGVFRLVAEQADPAARLSWTGGVAHLHSQLDRAALENFFLEKYKPTPIVGPWGARSGFYPGSSESSARDALNAIIDVADALPRLAPFRDVILTIRQLLSRHGYLEKVKNEDKVTLMQLCRNNLPDDLVPWLDAVFILTDDSRKFPPLLGTGGNEGSGSYVSTFAQVVVSLLIKRENNGAIANALFGEFRSSIGGLAVGHFNPGAIGGANSSQGFGGGGGVNAWDYLLAVEGCLLFAGGAARRYGTDTAGRAAYPFCVEAVPVGYASESEKEAGQSTRAEVWLPVWSSQVTFGELSRMFAEGRTQLGRRQARNSVEFALALATLGVSRGIDGFIRYAFVMRNGLSYFAAPLGRIKVEVRPHARLLQDSPLADWVHRLREACRDNGKTPDRYQASLREIDRAIFEFASRSEQGNDSKYLLEVLRALGRAERTLAIGLAFCKDKHLRPLQGLSLQWLIDVAPNGEAGREFRLAAGLASIMAEPKTALGPLRAHLEPVEQKGQWANWSPGSTSVVWSNRPLAENLAAVLVRRLIESERAAVKGCGLRARIFAPLEDVIAFMSAETDDQMLTDLLWALVGLKWTSDEFRQHDFHKRRAAAFRSPLVSPVPAAFGLIRMALTPLKLTTEKSHTRGREEHHWRMAGRKDSVALTTTPTPEPFHQLARGDLSEAENLAAQRLWSDRIVPFGWANRRQRQRKYQTGSAINPIRLLAACLLPLSPNSLTRLAQQALQPPAVIA